MNLPLSENEDSLNNKIEYKRLRLFTFFPDDMDNEYYQLCSIIDDLNNKGNLAGYLDLQIELHDWMEYINKIFKKIDKPLDFEALEKKPQMLDLHNSDFFIGTIWLGFERRFQKKNETTQLEQALEIALCSFLPYTGSKILMFQCSLGPEKLDSGSLKKLDKIQKIFAKIKNKQDNANYRTFHKQIEFEKKVREYLAEEFRHFGKKFLGKEVPKSIFEIATPDPSRSLPPREPFFGRKEELEKILQGLEKKRGWGVIIDGLGGMGKTALSVEAAYICKERKLFDDFIFITARNREVTSGFTEEDEEVQVNLESIINNTAKLLGYTGISQIMELSKKEEALLEVLKGRKILLIYDNLETLSEEDQKGVVHFLRRLPQGNKAITSSRHRTAEAGIIIHLEKMKWDDTYQLIMSQIQQETDSSLKQIRKDNWKEFYEVSGGHPLSMIWTLGLMKSQEISFNDGLRILGKKDPETELNTFIFQESFNRLEKNEKLTLWSLSYFAKPTGIEELIATSGLEKASLEKSLRKLYSFSLIDMDIEEKYTLHMLAFRFAKASLAKNLDEEHQLGIRFVSYWRNFIEENGGEHFKNFNKIENEWANIVSAMDWIWKSSHKNGTLQKHDFSLILPKCIENLRWFLDFWGYWSEQINLNMKSFYINAIFENFVNAGIHGYWACISLLKEGGKDKTKIKKNDMEIKKNNMEIKRHNQIKRWFKKIKSVLEGNNHNLYFDLVGKISFYFDDLKTAQKAHKKALTYNKGSGTEWGNSVTLIELGRVEMHNEKYSKAFSYFEDALKKARKINALQLQNIILYNLANLVLAQKQKNKAKDYFKQSLEISIKIGDILHISKIKYSLAEQYFLEENFEQAFLLAKEAISICGRKNYELIKELKILITKIEERLNEEFE